MKLSYGSDYCWQVSYQDSADAWSDPSTATSFTTEPAYPGGAVAYWRLDETGGTNAPDETGNNDGTLSGGIPAWSSDSISGSALDFDGSTDYVEVGDPADGSLDFGTGDFTLSVWVNFTKPSNSWTQFIYKQEAADPYAGYSFGYENRDSMSATPQYQKPQVGLDFGASNVKFYGTTDIADATWHFLTAVREGDAFRIYVDGTEENSFTGASGNVNSSGNLFFGAHCPTAGYLNGLIDEVAVYPYALTANEIQQRFAAGLQAPDAPINNAVTGAVQPVLTASDFSDAD